MSKFKYLDKSGTDTTITVFLKRHLDIRSKNGLEWQALCPFHDDTSPSLSVNIRKGVYICYACGAKGNLKTLAKHFDDNEPTAVEASVDEVMDALAELSEQAYMTTRPQVGIKYPEHLYRNSEARNYWCGVRNLTEQQFEAYQLGFDIVEAEAIIPLKDINGRCLGLIRRVTDQAKLDAGYPKYRYPKGFKISKHLFGVGEALEAFHRLEDTKKARTILVVCEGSVDAISATTNTTVVGAPIPSQEFMKSYGHCRIAGVAVLGARISYTQANAMRNLAPNHIVIATDQDRAGRIAAIQIEKHVRSMMLGCWIHQLTWDAREGKDLAELSLHNRTHKILAATAS